MSRLGEPTVCQRRPILVTLAQTIVTGKVITIRPECYHHCRRTRLLPKLLQPHAVESNRGDFYHMRNVGTKSVEPGDPVELTRDDGPSSSTEASSSAEQVHHVAARATRFKFWPEGALGPRLRIREVNLNCWALASVFIVLPVSILLWNHVKTGEGFDFVYFYGAGLLTTERPIPTCTTMLLSRGFSTRSRT